MIWGFPLWYNARYRFSYIAFIMLSYVPSSLSFFLSFKKRGLVLTFFFVKTFFCISWNDCDFCLSLRHFLTYNIYWFLYINPSLHLWNKISLTVVNVLFSVFKKIFWQWSCSKFVSVFFRVSGLWFPSFLVASLSSLGTGVIGTL